MKMEIIKDDMQKRNEMRSLPNRGRWTETRKRVPEPCLIVESMPDHERIAIAPLFLRLE